MDKTNWKLLKLLEQNGRLTYAELGKLVYLTAPAVSRASSKVRRVRCHYWLRCKN